MNAIARDVSNVLSRGGYKFTVIPQAAALAGATTRPAAPADATSTEALKQKWEHFVKPRAADVRDAARTHYQIVGELRREQQRLIDQADAIQRTIDQLDKQ